MQSGTQRAMLPMSGTQIAELDAEAYAAAITGLAALLVDAVDSGASVNFLAGLDAERAAAWWAERTEAVADGEMVPFVARVGGRIVGVTLLLPSAKENSPHRAEIAKVLVHRSVRRQGIARRLLETVESAAAARGLTLLVLDTEAGSPAEQLYLACGWEVTGSVPGYALTADGRPTAATFMWKTIPSRPEDLA
jgi:GNAT superfamily N-acetyltransferase